MMTALVNDPAGANPSLSTHTPHQKQIQATAEQIRLAQMIYDKNDAEFEDKVKQLVEVTGRSQDECMVTLHDCNGDINRAINLLLEGGTDQSSWETVGKRRGLGKDGVSETRENREKRGERDMGRGRATARRGRGGSRAREGESAGFDSSNRRGRGRGFGMRGRGRGGGVSRFTSQGMGTFNAADYGSGSAHAETGEADVNGGGAGPWTHAVDDWVAEDWSEDLSETKVFTSSTAVNSTHLTPANRMDLCTLMSQTGQGTDEVVDADPEPLGQSLVFTNSQHSTRTRTATHSYAAAASGSGACGGGSAAMAKVAAHSEPLVAMEPLSITTTTTSRVDPPPAVPAPAPAADLTPTPPAAPSTETHLHAHTHLTSALSTHIQPSTTSSASFSSLPTHSSTFVPSPSSSSASVATVSMGDSKTSRTAAPTHIQVPIEPEPSAILSQHALQPAIATSEASHPSMPEGSSLGTSFATELPAPLRHSRPPRRRPVPPSKIPSSAVEMPGSADVSGLNVQFGALDFASEPITMETTQTDSSSDITHNAITQNTLPPRSASDTVASSMETVYPAPSRGLPTASGPQSSTQHTATTHAPSTTTTPLTNGFSEVQQSNSQDALKSDVAPPPSSASPVATPTHSVSMTALSSHVTGSTVSSSTSPSMTMSAEVPVANTPTGAPGLTPNGRNTGLPNTAPGKTLPPMVPSQYIMGPGGLMPAYPQIYGYEDMQMMQSRLPMDYYGMTYPATTATIPGRDGMVANNPYSGDTTKFGRGDAGSPVPPTSLSSAQAQAGLAQAQAASGQQAQQQQQQTQAQAFLSPPLPPGYSYPAMPYYPAMPGTFQYPLLMPTNAKQPAQYQPYAGFDDLSQGADFSKGYGGSGQNQPKGANSSGKVNSGVPDMGGYGKNQSFEKAGFHTATPPPFSLPSALGGATAYGHTPFLHILPAHQQPHSQMMQGVPGQRSQNSGVQQKSGKNSYSNSAYWAN